MARLAIRLRGCHVPAAVGVGLVQPIAAREAVAATGEHQRPLALACHRPDVRKHLARAGGAASEVGADYARGEASRTARALPGRCGSHLLLLVHAAEDVDLL